MKELAIAYVQPRGSEDHLKDPLIKRLKERAIFSVTTFYPDSADLELQLELFVQKAETEEKTCVIIVQMFLEPEKEGVLRGRWDPDDKRLMELLDRPPRQAMDKRMKGLLLVWKIWSDIPGKFHLCATPGQTRMSVRSWQMLMSAFGEGPICKTYLWWANKVIAEYVGYLANDILSDR